MLDYEWGNPGTMMLSGEEETAPDPDQDQARQIFNPYTQTFNNGGFNPHPTTAAFSHFNVNPQQQTHSQLHHSFFDPRAFPPPTATSYLPTQLLSLDHPVSGGAGSGGGYLLVPKSEETVSRPVDFVSRLGLNLGGRTYFSSAEDEFVNRLYRRSRPAEQGSANSPRCQAEGCNADLTHAKHYHRRHKVCEFHSKASTVIAAGLTQRFCQQCSRLCQVST
jgi:hypothetical protein